MSTAIVAVKKVDFIKEHPAADRLEIAYLGSWQVVVPKGRFVVGDIGVFIPVDYCIPDNLAERWGVKSYLNTDNRVRAVKLRGVPSCGIFINDVDFPLIEGENVIDKLSIKKWEPPEKIKFGNAETPHNLFPKYYHMENYRNFEKRFTSDMEVIITEKIHGTNFRNGIVFDENTPEGLFLIGSHTVRRKIGDNSLYEKPLNKLKPMLLHLKKMYPEAISIVVFGEVYGDGVQDLTYGLKKSLDFAVFDICINVGSYLDFDIVTSVCNDFHIFTVPFIYRGKFNKEILDRHVSGNTLISDEVKQIREGIVIRTAKESSDEYGRLIMKYVSNDYYCRNNGTEYH